MPPKAKFTKEQIVNAALDIIRENGTSELTARALGKRLGSSACPIFTVFDNMEEVLTETVKAAKILYSSYITEGLKATPAFKGVGMQYLNFAVREPKLFQLLFMTEQAQNPTMENVLPIIDDSYPIILKSVKDSYDLTQNDAERLYQHLWVYTHGIAALIATKMCAFTPEETGKMLTEVRISVLNQIKGGASDD